jgi:HlyD family secretion protein
VGTLLPRPPSRESKPKETNLSGSNQQQVWVLKDGQPVAVSVTTGDTDGVMTVILDGDIEPGMSLVVDIISKGK